MLVIFQQENPFRFMKHSIHQLLDLKSILSSDAIDTALLRRTFEVTMLLLSILSFTSHYVVSDSKIRYAAFLPAPIRFVVDLSVACKSLASKSRQPLNILVETPASLPISDKLVGRSSNLVSAASLNSAVYDLNEII